MKLFKEPYIYDVHTEKGEGMGGLEIRPVFADSIVLKQ